MCDTQRSALCGKMKNLLSPKKKISSNQLSNFVDIGRYIKLTVFTAQCGKVLKTRSRNEKIRQTNSLVTSLVKTLISREKNVNFFF